MYTMFFQQLGYNDLDDLEITDYLDYLEITDFVSIVVICTTFLLFLQIVLIHSSNLYY